MFDLIFKPAQAIAACKKQKGFGNAWMKLIVGSVILGIWGVILGLIMQLPAWPVVGMFFLMAVLVFLGNIFNSWMYYLAINILSGKGKYSDTFTAMANGLIIMSVGLVLATLIFLIPGAGVAIAILLLILMAVISYVVIIKTLTTMTGADLLTVVVGMVVVFIASIIVALLLNGVVAFLAQTGAVAVTAPTI